MHTTTTITTTKPYSNNNHVSYKQHHHNHHHQSDQQPQQHEKPADLPTPPPSPIGSTQHSMAATLESNGRILSAKREGNLKAVMSEFGTMKKQRIPLTHHTYNLVLDAHANLRREGTPLTNILKIYDEMIRAHIPPSGYTYTVLLRVLCKRDVEVQKTVAMLKRQSARTGIGMDDIGQLESEGNLKRALELFRMAVEHHIHEEFEVEIYNQLLRVLSHYGNTVDANFVYEQLEHSPHTQPNSATFAALINLMGRAGQIQSALDMFDHYIAIKDTLGLHDASYVYNALVDAYLKCGQLDEALRVVEQEMTQDDIKVTVIPYNSIIRHYCAQGEMTKARHVVNKLQENHSGLLPVADASSYGPILSAYCQSNEWQPASEIYAQLIKTDIAKAYGNLANYALLCIAHAHGHDAIEVVKDMHRAGLEPDPILVTRIVLFFSSVSDATTALSVALQAMSSRTIIKGSSLLLQTVLRVMQGATLVEAIDIVRVVAGPLGFPAAMAKALVECWRHDNNNDDKAISHHDVDYAPLVEAALMIPDEPCLSDVVIDLLEHRQFMPPPHQYARVLGRLQQLKFVEAETKWKAAVASIDEVETLSNQVLKAATRGHVEDALKTMEHQILRRGLTPFPEAMRDAIVLIGKQGHMDSALRLFELSMEAFKNEDARARYLVMNSILIVYAQQGDMVPAKRYYDDIKQMGFFPDGNAYASLLLGSAKCATDEATDALTIYDEAKRHNVKPTTFFYNVVISKLAKARKLEPTLRLFDEMQQFKIIPNCITYGAIISACVRAGSELQARRLFGEMLSAPSYQPRVGPFNNMIQFYVRQQPSRERALEYVTEMRRRRIKPSAHTYKLLMEAYSTIAPYDMPTAHRMLSDMEKRDKIQPQATHYATLIYSYGSLQRDVKSAEQVFAEMNKAQVTPDEAVYQAMLDTLISNDRMERAEELYREMLQNIRKSCSPYIENLFIRGYGQKGLLDKAEAMFDIMTDNRMLRSKHATTEYIVVREPSTYEAMVQAYLDNNMMGKAKEVLDRMVKRDFPEKVVAAVADLVLE
ncbi:hypothetical protein BDA99DRAFT_466916 [Phascolomyces articulosus]|uniref:Pentacotripeptide-repeat region of PRORP domain-containing protein n=1 Tax=Phascolomyces articulosus TaxID=60185 RepID=A0AAD5K956_9FUNG|nr:hypothetical protein BDA99DRAFT_466916 [Phascolomyces articulosus]